MEIMLTIPYKTKHAIIKEPKYYPLGHLFQDIYSGKTCSWMLICFICNRQNQESEKMSIKR